MKKEKRSFYAVVMVLIILISMFVIVVQYQFHSISEAKQPLSVKIFADKAEGTTPFNVNFSSIVTNYKGDVTYRWDFGNENISNEREPTVFYDTDGEYVCSLTVIDENSQTETDSIIIKAKENKPPIVTLSINRNAIDRKFNWLSVVSLIPLKIFTWPGNHQEILDDIEKKQGANVWGEGRIVVTAQISDPEDDEIVSYEWREQTGDSLLKANGEPVHPVHFVEGNLSARIPELYTWTPFEHVVMLTVTDSAGNKANATAYFTVSENVTKTKFKQRANLLIQVLLLTIYDRLLPEEYKHMLSDPLWKIIDKISPYGLIKFVFQFLFGNIFPQDIPKADLNNSFDNNIYDHSETINPNGGVSKTTSITHSINIRNDDTSNTAKDVYIKLTNPIEDKNGLDDELENDKIIVTLKTSDTNETLYANKVYTDGFLIGDLTPGSEFNGKLIVTFLEADNGNFMDNKDYNCSLYVYQEQADYWRWNIGLPLLIRPPLDEIKFNINT